MFSLNCCSTPGVCPTARTWCRSTCRSDPVKAYGQYAFEAGFKLGMSLAVSSLAADQLSRLE